MYENLNLKLNTLLVQIQKVEYSTESGIIIDQVDQNMVSCGVLLKNAYCNDYSPYNNQSEFMIPEKSIIKFSKDVITMIGEDVGIVEYKNVICWESPKEDK